MYLKNNNIYIIVYIIVYMLVYVHYLSTIFTNISQCNSWYLKCITAEKAVVKSYLDIINQY